MRKGNDCWRLFRRRESAVTSSFGELAPQLTDGGDADLE